MGNESNTSIGKEIVKMCRNHPVRQPTEGGSKKLIILKEQIAAEEFPPRTESNIILIRERNGLEDRE